MSDRHTCWSPAVTICLHHASYMQSQPDVSANLCTVVLKLFDALHSYLNLSLRYVLCNRLPHRPTLCQIMFSHFGVPETMHSDRGRVCHHALTSGSTQDLHHSFAAPEWNDFTTPWVSNRLFSLHNTSGTGMTICPWCSWRVTLQFKRPHPAPLLSSCWGESSTPQ